MRQEKPKADPTTQVVVFGDALAEFAGQGLGELFADSEDVAVIREGQGGWRARAHGSARTGRRRSTRRLGSAKKTNVAVVMLGTSDRQSLKQDDESYRAADGQVARDLYRGRVDAAMRAFKERNLPVVWIGLPPAKNAKTSDDFLAMNEIYKESVQRNGGAYVDIWPGFVDEDNRYTVTGPDVDGQPAKLRTNDGAFLHQGRLAQDRAFRRYRDQAADRSRRSPRRLWSPCRPPMIRRRRPFARGGAPFGSGRRGAGVAADEALIGPVLPLNQPVVTPGGTLVDEPAQTERRPSLSGPPCPARRDRTVARGPAARTISAGLRRNSQSGDS